MPSEPEYENVYQAAKDILLEFDVKGIDITSTTVNNSYIYNNTLHRPASFQAELRGDKLILTLPKDYMNDLLTKNNMTIFLYKHIAMRRLLRSHMKEVSKTM